jgi:GINS complex subunit 2
LWLALSLKRKKKCRIIGPEWLTVGKLPHLYIAHKRRADRSPVVIKENLEALMRAEKENPLSFVPLPRHFIEVSKVLLDA